MSFVKELKNPDIALMAQAKATLLCLNICNHNTVSVFKWIENKLWDQVYVHLYAAPSGSSGSSGCVKPLPTRDLMNYTAYLYAAATSLAPSVDVTILQRYKSCDVKLTASVKTVLLEKVNALELEKSVKEVYGIGDAEVIPMELDLQTTEQNQPCKDYGLPYEQFNYTALGGTFDNIHAGHKILLSTALALTKKSITIGITMTSMNKKKTLCELIRPYEERRADVHSYLSDVNPYVDYNIVPLEDPFGPTITERHLQCLIVSEETAKGGHAVNQKRKENGFEPMSLATIPIIEDPCRSEHQEQKISSSSCREQLLGTLIRKPERRPHLKVRPYMVGLTGGIASGKSSVGKRLEALGAGLINSDLLAHETYKRDGKAYKRIVEAFGTDILDSKRDIKRKELGSIVFADNDKLQLLNSIVWPAVAELVKERVEQLHQDGKEVCFIEAALMLEAGWKDNLHEVWCCVIPQEEAVKRIVERNQMSEEEALKRIQSQSDNHYRVNNSNVVLCTLWDYSVTQKQVEKAWSLLQKRLHECKY